MIDAGLEHVLLPCVGVFPLFVSQLAPELFHLLLQKRNLLLFAQVGSQPLLQSWQIPRFHWALATFPAPRSRAFAWAL